MPFLCPPRVLQEALDATIMRSVPRLKQACETFVLGIRFELERAGVAGGFSIANLKHRNIQGMEVGSQIVEAEEEEEEEEDDDNDAASVEGATTVGLSEAGDDLAGAVAGLMAELEEP